ncbi:cupin domain-containing protein [Trabulsiella odontotermitis]|uniref:cupin domain-containing protein n=1 Tax=Trabulsiella odontotermitis TaxID=379893 RepID=UPI000675D0FA|nr:cupin domain-containing protein [Trabulsiella odontotermitis]KNC87947.1 cupin [Trabulsiella odontotermitis]
MYKLQNETKLEVLGNGVSRRILAHAGQLMAVEVHFDTGAMGAMHSRPHEQLTYILSGEFVFTIGDETRKLAAGDTLYKRPVILHDYVCLTAGVLLDTFTPLREDFL